MRYRFADVEVDASGREVRRRGQAVALEPRAFDLLLYLLRNRERVVSKDELLDRLWPNEEVMEGALSVCVHRARGALGAENVIRTFPRRGYRFTAEVVELPDPPADPRAAAFPLAGRRTEIALLRGAVDAALAGATRIVLIAGEPGIGKTRLLEETGRYARRQGARVLWGEGNRYGGEAPFGIWADILAAYVGSRSEAEAVAVLGREASLLAHILPSLRSLAGGEGFDDGEDHQDAEKLFSASAAILRRAAAESPLVLILDDLDAVDADSLLALGWIGRAAEEAPLLVAGAYRDTDLATDHPLRAVLASVAGCEGFELVTLGPLEESDVGTLVEDLAGTSVPSPLLRLIVRRAEGNPLFATEYWRYLSRCGLAVPGAANRESLTVPIRSAVPPGVRGIIRERLDRLSAACRRVLELASALGREFDRNILAEAAGATGADLSLALDEASDARLVTRLPEVRDRYRFSHALVAERLHAALLPDERAALHRRIAEAIERRHGAGTRAHLSELAHHFLAGADDQTADRAIDYAGRAANRAYSNLAFREAAHLFEQALLVLDRHRPASHRRRWQLLIGLAEVSVRIGDVARARRAYRRAIEALREGASAAAPGKLAVRDSPIEVARALAYTRLALHVPAAETDPFAVQAGRERRRTLNAAVETASAAGDVDSLLSALLAARWNAFAGPFLGAGLAFSTEAMLVAEQLDRPHVLQEARFLRIHDLLVSGLVGEADDELARYAKLGRTLDHPFYGWTTSYMRAMRAIMEGRFGEGEELARQARQAGTAVDAEVARATFGTQLGWMRSLQGRVTDLTSMIDAFAARQGAGDVARALLASLYCEIGREADGRRELEILGETVQTTEEPFWLHTVVGLVRPCARVGNERLAARFFDLLRPHANASAVMPIAILFNGPIACHLAILAEAAGRRKEAVSYFEQGMEDCLRLGARPTLAHAEYDYARALLARGGRVNRSKAITLLGRAERTARELEMAGLSKWIEEIRTQA